MITKQVLHVQRFGDLSGKLEACQAEGAVGQARLVKLKTSAKQSRYSI